MNRQEKVDWNQETRILAKVISGHQININDCDGEPVNLYCIKMKIPMAYTDDVVCDFANDLFHELGVLDEKSELSFGEWADCCMLYKDEEAFCYCVAFNHHDVIDAKLGSEKYRFSVAAMIEGVMANDESSGNVVRKGLDDDSSEFDEWEEGEKRIEQIMGSENSKSDRHKRRKPDSSIKRPTAKRRAEIERQIANAMEPYHINPMIGEINPFCYNVQVEEGEADEPVIIKAFNDMFHSLGVLLEDDTLEIGEGTDYCEIYKTDEGYFAPFNDPVIMELDEDDENYRYVLKAMRVNEEGCEDAGDDDGEDYEMDYKTMLKEAEKGMRCIAKAIKSGEIRSPSEEGCFVLKAKDYDNIADGKQYIVRVDFDSSNVLNSIGIKMVCIKKARAKAQMRFEVKSVTFMDSDDRECDPYNIPSGFIATTIAIHLGKMIG